jgi:hypothetical protein
MVQGIQISKQLSPVGYLQQKDKQMVAVNPTHTTNFG